MEQTMKNKNISSYIIQSQDEEIKRIALELHEGVGQTLYSLYTGLQFIETGLEQPAMKPYMKEMFQLMEKTLQEIRLLSLELHPPTLTTFGLLPAVKSYCKLFTSTYGIMVHIESTGEERAISETKNIAIFRVCQEALANIAKYADVTEATISFTWGLDFVKIIIEDKGKGFDVEEKLNINHLSGLEAMKERMVLAGGECLISSKLGIGTSIEIYLRN
ncbi:sensor histidine kinase [Bacillus sp. V59.32b]|uniref:sensor histidine kinase n=1 Tax=Bacillus sp. V59.32b TaxID=1758642 RepID=UPI000E3E31B0|nr:histidine kinase [Bacillus sp. V59.32b]RFU69480.1 sensor histidine kinase [Bacillus sp. V59.32b]